MTRRVLLDTNFLVAEADAADSLHAQSSALRKVLEQHGVQIILLDVVIAETLSVLSRRCAEGRRRTAFGKVLDAFLLRVPVDAVSWVGQEIRRHYEDILADVRATSGRRNFNDALLIQVARAAGVEGLVSYDADFDDVHDLVRLFSPDSVVAWMKDGKTSK